MEKSSDKQERKFFSGLLKGTAAAAILLASGLCFAKTPSPQQIRQLVVQPDSEVFFTARENGYTLKIPGIEPSQVLTELPALPLGISYASSKKEEFVDENGQRGTLVHLWFNFKDTGPVRMPPLIVNIGNRTYYLSFGDVTVYENPAVISPVMEVEFEKGAQITGNSDGVQLINALVGEEIIFTLKLRYFVQIIHFDWKLPENSIFSELERYEITRGVPAGSDFSSESLPVARFSWKPLKEGTYSLPDISIFATAYNGGRKTVSVPACQIKVSPGSAISAPSFKIEDSGAFDSAFTQKRNISGEVRGSAVTADDCKKLARLRSRERHSFPGSPAQAERKNFETSLGLSNRANETRKPVVIFVVFVTLIFAALFVFFMLIGKVRLCILMLVLSCGMVVASVGGILKLLPDYGIFCGGVISPVPETVTSSIHTFEGGLRVKISERAGDYFYIESSDVNGWVYKDLVYEVK